MKKTLILAVAIFGLVVQVSMAGPRDGLWDQVSDAISRDLPKTAMAVLDQIIPGALADGAHAEATKAICWKIALEGQIQGYKAEEKITRLIPEIAQAPAPMQPMMQAILAHWYWEYFQQNNWRIMQRTQTAQAPGEDLTTWDLVRIMSEIDRQFAMALAADQQFKATPIAEWGFLLAPGKAPDTYRPTLYDFLAHDALSFYNAGEQAGIEIQDAFEIMADGPIFAPVAEFLAWEPQTLDTGSARLKAVRLYQDLLAFHQADADPTAFWDADLLRLQFGYNLAVGPDKAAIYVAGLGRLAAESAGHEIAARVLHAWAQVLYSEGDYVQARALATQGWTQYPASAGGVWCHNLAMQVEAPSASIRTERVWSNPLPEILVTYRNVTKVFFRAVPYAFDPTAGPVNTYLGEKQIQALLDAEPVLQWSQDLPATQDYKGRTEALPAPGGLDKGLYYLIASHDPSFKAGNNQISIAPVWVSDLALVVRTTAGMLDGFVLQAETGVPIAGAAVTRWTYDSKSSLYVSAGQTLTDPQGRFEIVSTGQQSRSYFLVAQYQGQTLASEGTYWIGPESGDPVPYEQTVFFTDRSLYRPGQTIQYKGICIRVDQASDTYQTLARRALTVVFADTSGQEIGRLSHTCNDYGSFSGSFIAPQDRLLGRMSLSVEGGPWGSASVNVEQYKRPQFRVQFNPPADAPRLNEQVIVPGAATAYTGAAIGGAKVQWSVIRQVRWPVWSWWRWYGPVSQAQALARGEALTRADGSFEIQFLAKPDLSVPEADEPVFEFQVHADVTDTSGETRSADRTVRAGYTALQAAVSADDWQTQDSPVVLTITTQSLDSEPQAAAGTISLYALQQPSKVIRPSLLSTSSAPDASDPKTWALAGPVSEQAFATDATGQGQVAEALQAGVYRAVLRAQDRFGKAVAAEHTFVVVDLSAGRFPVRVANHFAAPSWSVQPGDQFVAMWCTGYDTGQAYVELECRGQVLSAGWTDPNSTQHVIRQAVTEDMRGGFTVRATYVRENRAYVNERIVSVPWTKKDLTVAWERFRSLLEPGQQEIWTAIVTGPDARAAVAEMVAALYDASLDQYLPHDWVHGLSGFRQEDSRLSSRFENNSAQFLVCYGWSTSSLYAEWSYRHYPTQIVGDGHFTYWGGAVRGRTAGRGSGAVPPAPEDKANTGSSQTTGPDLDHVPVRTNLDETAFFFPHLISGKDGVVRIEFTMPEALTTWRFLGFAHDQAMRSGFLTDTTITAKDLMIQPNPPRFVREGDVIEFTVRVSNQSAARQTGKVALTLADARTLEPRDQALGNLTPEQTFDVPSKESRTYSWRLTIPDGCELLVYKAVGATDRLSDGQQDYLPVLSRRTLVIESLPLPIRGAQTKAFEFTHLLQSGLSDTLVHQSLTVQMVSQPAWYAVMALPYLMERPYQSSDQVFNRLYANTLAAYIANSDPKIRYIFDQWKATPALDSPLEKNEDLKAVTLEETPWVRQAISESEARRNVGLLFDRNRLDAETSVALFQLQQMQYADGLWPWFPGCRGNEYITLVIVTGFGRLRHLGVRDLDVGCAVKALGALDAWMDRLYRDPYHEDLSFSVALYLYGRSFFLNDQPVAAQHQEALNYWLGQARAHWLDLWRQSQAHLTIGLKRFGDVQTATAIMQSIHENSVTDEELGMFWRDTERSWWWYRAPIETQALMIEAFDEVVADANAVEACRVWLLKQKQTQDWGTSRATADAVYSLLLRGTNLLSSNALVEVALGGQWIVPEQVEAGTGFWEERFVHTEIHPDMGQITVKKTDEGVSWGSVHWQYLEDMAKVPPYEGTPLTLTKALFTKQTTSQGQVLFPVTGPVAVGDELVVRIELRVDRDMEYVHLKDQRPSGTEPVNVLSRYRYQDGLGYYESTRDTASHFFMDWLPKGTYVFEYSTRVQHKGTYQSGLASIQCLYAPEFNSHSESFELVVGD